MSKKVSTGKTIFKIACATGGAILTSGVGLPWLGAMAGSCLPKVLEGSLNPLVSAIEDDKKQEVLASLLQKPIEQLASLGINFTNDRIEGFLKSHFEGKRSDLNFDLPRVVVKVWDEALNKMLHEKRKVEDNSILGLNRTDQFEIDRKELLTFWRQKLHNAQSDNDLLKEFFGEKPDYFLEVEKGKVPFIDALPDQEQVEILFWERIEVSFTNWAENEEKFPEDWTNSIHQSLKDELRQNLFHNFSSALKKELKENERAWKSFEFASSLQTVSILQSLASNTDQIKYDTSNIKKDLAELNMVLPLVMRDILTRFDTLENTVKKYFNSNQKINELLIGFRKEVSDKLNKIGRGVNETKDYAKTAAENTKQTYRNLVTFQEWKEWKEKRAGNQSQSEFDYIETSEIDSFIKSFIENIFSAGKHLIIKGDIGSGKSTIIKRIGDALLKINPNIEIIILPLTHEFQLEEGWQRRDSCFEFNARIKETFVLKKTNTVFIVEDAHEGEGDPGHKWAVKLNESLPIELSTIPIIVTTRPDRFKDVKKCLSNSWKIEEPKIYETSPDDIVEKLIAQEFDSEKNNRKLREAYLKCGKSLLIFNEILIGWINDKKTDEGDFMRYAYRAVYEEMKRILPENAKDNETSRLTVMLLWMAGGLEIGLDESFLSSNFRVYSENLLKHLEKSNEIHRDNQNRYISSRHPAWGLLAIKSFDVFNESFLGIQQEIRERFLKSLDEELHLEKEREIRHAKPSVLFMTSLLKSKIVSVDSLGFYCSGKHINDEFVTAAGYDIDIRLSKNNANKEELSVNLLSLAAYVRRSNAKGLNADDPKQRQELINEGYERLIECIKIREDLFGKNLEKDPRKGWVLYEESYYEFLKGDFNASANGFRKSRQAELESGKPERQPYAAISGVMEANSLIHDGKLNEAENLLNEMLEILESNNGSEKVLPRFKSNIYGAYVELSLAQRDTNAALKYIEKYIEELERGGFDGKDSIYKARISLIRADGRKAEELIKAALKDNDLMMDGESKIFAHRILGDALLLQNKKDEAYIEYNKILPPKDYKRRYLDFNLGLIEKRMQKIENGLPIKEAFDNIQI
jgi:hypothetical protein